MGTNVDRRVDLERTLTLLRRVLPGPQWDDPAYLEWWYDRYPCGAALEVSVDDDDQRNVHLAGIPARFRSASGERCTFVMIVNASAAPEVQRTGAYGRAMRSFREQAIARRYHATWGVSNEAGTPAALKSFQGATYIGSMVVRVRLALGVLPTGVRSARVDADFVSSSLFDEIAAELEHLPVDGGWVQDWTPELLAWRLQVPGRQYSVHVDREVIAVTTRSSFGVVPVAVVLKMFPRGGGSARRDPRRVIEAACRHHRAPIALYAGLNAFVPVQGFTIPRHRLPSPLNLIFSWHDLEAHDNATFTMDVLEFLDFDAY